MSTCMRAAIVVACLVVSACSPRWILKDRGQKVLLATSTAAIACDWGMTRWMPKTGGYEMGYAELNPIMGRNPSLGQIDAVFVGLIAANLASYWVLPKWAKAILYTSVTGLEAGNIAMFNPSGVCGDFGAIGYEADPTVAARPR